MTRSTKKAARSVLRSSLDAIKWTAQAIAVHTRELDPGKFGNPRADQALLTAARSAAQDAEPLAETFIAHAMPEFLESLETSIGNFQQAREEYASAKRASHYTGEQIEAMTQEAREVAKRLDAIVRNALSGDGATFAVWEKACHRWGPTIEGQELTANKSGDSTTCGGIEVSNSAGH